QRAPELPRLLRRVVIMGGSYRSPGNTAPTTEWNVNVDPESARIVFEAFGAETAGFAASVEGLSPASPSAPGSSAGPESPDVLGSPGRPIALGLDVTERAKLLPHHLAELAAVAGCSPDGTGRGGRINPIVRYLADSLRFYMEFHSRYDHFFGAFIHDPLALAAALDPSLVKTEPLTVDVELNGRLTTGETVADWRRVWGRPPNLDVAVEADVALFFERFIERVGALAARS
ncbi:MAG: nucleoside hydrolase, partial [Candidatus Limnocylindrales bacterium]